MAWSAMCAMRFADVAKARCLRHPELTALKQAFVPERLGMSLVCYAASDSVKWARNSLSPVCKSMLGVKPYES